jgi:hypothetical protein
VPEGGFITGLRSEAERLQDISVPRLKLTVYVTPSRGQGPENWGSWKGERPENQCQRAEQVKWVQQTQIRR